MKTMIFIEAEREGYSPDQIYKTLTVAELKEVLDQFDDDAPVYLSHDGGYTYGGIRYENIDVRFSEDDSDETEDTEEED